MKYIFMLMLVAVLGCEQKPTQSEIDAAAMKLTSFKENCNTLASFLKLTNPPKSKIMVDKYDGLSCLIDRKNAQPLYFSEVEVTASRRILHIKEKYENY